MLKVNWGQNHSSEVIIEDKQLFLSELFPLNLKHLQTLNAPLPPARLELSFCSKMRQKQFRGKLLVGAV